VWRHGASSYIYKPQGKCSTPIVRFRFPPILSYCITRKCYGTAPTKSPRVAKRIVCAPTKRLVFRSWRRGTWIPNHLVFFDITLARLELGECIPLPAADLSAIFPLNDSTITLICSTWRLDATSRFIEFFFVFQSGFIISSVDSTTHRSYQIYCYSSVFFGSLAGKFGFLSLIFAFSPFYAWFIERLRCEGERSRRSRLREYTSSVRVLLFHLASSGWGREAYEWW
jgi:hypothetical protein